MMSLKYENFTFSWAAAAEKNVLIVSMQRYLNTFKFKIFT